MSNSGARETTQSKNKCLLCRQGLLGTQNSIQVKAGWDVAITSALGAGVEPGKSPKHPGQSDQPNGWFPGSAYYRIRPIATEDWH